MTRIHHCTVIAVASIGLAASQSIVRAQATTGTVRGQVVVTVTRAPVANAIVSLDTRGASTNDAGRFSFGNVAAGRHTLRVRMIGYAPYTGEVTVTAGQAVEVTVVMETQTLNLDEVVVTGTAGAAQLREIGNSIGTVELAAAAQMPASLDVALQGRVPGLTVTANSGGVGGGASIRLRGNVSASMNNQPLIYVDGVRMKSDGFPKNMFPGSGSTIQRSDNSVYSPLNDINPNDIERIEVIKGPAATTLYGTEAAAGVIQIFTKNGRSGQTRWTFETTQSTSKTPKYGPTEGFDGKPLAIPASEVNEYGTVDYMYMDPFLRTGHRQRYSASLDGGGENVQYFASGSWSDERGVLPLDKQQQNSVRGNLSLTPRPNVTIQWNTTYSNGNLQKTPSGGGLTSLTLNTSRRVGNYFGSEDPAVIAELLKYKLTSRVDHLITGGTIAYQPRENLTTRLILGYDLAGQEARTFMPYGFLPVPLGQSSDNTYTSRTATADWATTWNVQLRPSVRASLSAGAQSVAVEQLNLVAASRDFPGPGQQTVSNGAVFFGSEDRIRVINAGFFGQSVFDIANRYFLTLGMRVDGNSAFGEGLGLQSYPKVSGSYVISDEQWWWKNVGTMKLRGAWGQSGRAPGAFDAVRTWSTYSWGGSSTFLPRNLGNSQLGPERTSETELGFDAAAPGARLQVGFTWYRRNTRDALFAVRNAPSNGGWGSQLANVGKLQSHGIELNMTGLVINRPQFSWELGGTVSTNNSEVVSLGGAAPFSIGTMGWIMEGQPVPVVRGFCVENENEFAAPVRKADCIIGPNTPTRTFTGVSTFTLPYNLQVSARGEYQGNFFGRSFLEAEGIVRGIRWPACFNSYPAIDAGDLSTVTAKERGLCIASLAHRDYAVFPLDFFRLRDVTVRWVVPFRVSRAASTVVSLSGQNLFWWKKAKSSLLDAETSGGFNDNDVGMLSQVRTVGGSVPIPRTYVLSVRVVY